MKMFSIGEFVYLQHDSDQVRRMVTRIQEAGGGFTYCLSAGTSETWHYDFEISRDIDVLAKIEASEREDAD